MPFSLLSASSLWVFTALGTEGRSAVFTQAAILCLLISVHARDLGSPFV